MYLSIGIDDPSNLSFDSWYPASVLALRQYDVPTFRRDVVAGVTVGLVALPLAMAFAIASGVAPAAGIYCAVITGFIISALGGSRVQIGGPTGAFVVVVSDIIARHGLPGLFMCTMMAGVILIVLGLTGTGAAVRFIPRPVIIGFTNGIAILIASTQIRDFFGVQVAENTGELIPRMQALASHWSSWSPQATGVAVVALLTIVVAQRLRPALPGTVVALVGGTAAVWLAGLPVETVGSRFGAIPTGWPQIHVPDFEPALLLTLLSPAMTVAMLGAIESLMSAVVGDRMTGGRHNPNVELVAQGVANVVSPLFGGLPATGAIARTATNVRSGGVTPVSGMVHAVTLAAIVAFAAGLAARVPMPVLAAILFVVAYRMGEWHEVRGLLRQSRADIAIWLATFLLTVFADLTVAVEVGMVMAALLYIRRVSATTTVSLVTPEYIESGRPHILQDKIIPADVAIVRIHGPFLFGATDKLTDVLDIVGALPAYVIVRLRNMTAVDATGLEALGEFADKIRASGRTAIFCGARRQPGAAMERAGLAERVGRENFCPHVAAALARAAALRKAKTIDAY